MRVIDSSDAVAAILAQRDGGKVTNAASGMQSTVQAQVLKAGIRVTALTSPTGTDVPRWGIRR